MTVFLTVLFTLIALALYVSLWVPNAGRYFYWKGSDIKMGFVSRAGFAMVFGVPTLVLTVGPPSERYEGVYLAVMILGFALVVLGFIYDWLRDNA